METSLQWARGRLVESELADQLLDLISELRQEIGEGQWTESIYSLAHGPYNIGISIIIIRLKSNMLSFVFTMKFFTFCEMARGTQISLGYHTSPLLKLKTENGEYFKINS